MEQLFDACGLSLAFSKKPKDVRVALGEEVVFQCQFPGADVIEWKLNNRSLAIGEQNINMDISIRDNITLEEGGHVHTLKIPALKPYNETTVKCLASFFNGCQSTMVQESPAVTLLIQGKLLW